MNLASPVIAGTDVVGNRLVTSTGTWLGSPAPGFSYQWQRCKPGCVNIPGAVANSYRLTTADYRAAIRVIVIAANTAGDQVAASADTPQIAPSTAQIASALLSHIVPHNTLLTLHTLLRNKAYRQQVAALEAGRITISWITARAGHERAGTVVASGHTSVAGPAVKQIVLRLTMIGDRLLKRDTRLRLTAEATFTDGRGTTVTVQKRFSL